jgi:outer membrane cobalamin receptor
MLELSAAGRMAPAWSRTAHALAIALLSSLVSALHAQAEPPPSEQQAPPETAPPAVVDVVVQRQLDAREQLQRSSDAVTVVDLQKAHKRSSDLGEVLARVAGVSVRRFGGLGSQFRFSLNGLSDTQVRVFVDGVPVDRVYAMGLANLPLNLIQDVEIYRGVVPLRLGADALGGAVNLVSSAEYESALQASYQLGSFNTQRASVSGRYRHDASGFVAGLDAYLDHADNDYKIDVEIPDEQGSLSPARVRRFHDAYDAYGVAAEVGVVDRSWARRLIARGFVSSYDKQIQNNVVMTVPYGEPHYGARVEGGVLTYQNEFARRCDLDLIASYTHRSTDFIDKGRWVYNWYGQRVLERRVPGEIEAEPHDRTIWQHSGFARATLDVRLAPGHLLTLTSSPDYATRSGNERIQSDPSARDPLSGERQLFKLVSGISYTLRLVPLPGAPAAREELRPEHYRVENALFAKSYIYRADSQEALPGNVFRAHDKRDHAFGVGDTLRVTLAGDYLLAKASYEYATRLPEVDEVFGDGVLVHENLTLGPEVSHNANLGPQLDLRDTRGGDFWLDVNAFYRDSRDLIVLVGMDRYYSYENVYRARSRGIEGSARWSSPGRYLTLDAQATYMDLRNASTRGMFADFSGDRIPNRPWLFGSWGAALRLRALLWKRDRLEPFYQGRYVHEFFRSWESVGLREFKQTVPRQVSHDLGVTYSVPLGRSSISGTLEVLNVGDAKLYDTFGVQRPGRSYFLKLMAQL